MASESEQRSPLTPTEVAVLRAFEARGSEAGVAEELFIAAATVHTHAAHIREKLGVHHLSQAVALAIRRGWI
jgi:DNA-binding NarL/FixJ family response regulator